jgi:WD40 repeat protein
LQTGSLQRPLESDEVHWDLVRFSPDGKQLILYCDGRGEPFVTVFDLDKKKTQRHDLPKSHFVTFDVAPNGRTFAVASEGGLKIHSTKDGAEKEKISVKKVSAMTFSPDGKRLAVAAYDQPLRIYNAATGDKLGEIPDDFHAYHLAFSPDGKLLCGTSLSQRGRVWLADPSGKTAPTVEVPPRASFSCCAFAPEGRVLATGGDDGTLTLFDLDKPDSGRLEVQWGRNTVLAVAFSPDGRWLATGNGDDVRLWPYPALRRL